MYIQRRSRDVCQNVKISKTSAGEEGQRGYEAQSSDRHLVVGDQPATTESANTDICMEIVNCE